jgi:hypothetical protein
VRGRRAVIAGLLVAALVGAGVGVVAVIRHRDRRAAPNLVPDLPARAKTVPPGAYDTLPEPIALVPARGARPRVAELFGDSLVLQSYPYADAIARHRGYRLVGGAFGGLALCDERGSITSTLRREHPVVVILAFVGNALTPCMRPDGRKPTLQATIAKYRADVKAVIDAAHRERAAVWLTIPPRMRERGRDATARALGAAWKEIAANDPTVQLLDAGAELTPNGFTARLGCLPFEDSTLGCRAATILVRAEDGTHLAAAFQHSGYSSGMWRYASVLTGSLPG